MQLHKTCILNSKEYFKAIQKPLSLISQPFNFDVQEAPVEIQLELIDLQSNNLLKENFHLNELSAFYGALNTEHFKHFKNVQKIPSFIWFDIYL